MVLGIAKVIIREEEPTLSMVAPIKYELHDLPLIGGLMQGWNARLARFVLLLSFVLTIFFPTYAMFDEMAALECPYPARGGGGHD